MDDFELAKALVARLNDEQISKLRDHIDNLKKAKVVNAVCETDDNLDPIHSSCKLSIWFCESNAGSFSLALNHAERAQYFSKFIERKKTWYAASWNDHAFANATPLAGALASLRNKRCFVNGVERQWNEVFSYAACADQRLRAYRPTHYCFGRDNRSLNPWGCQQARMDWTEWASWFRYGTFEKRGFLSGGQLIWKFDKARIKHEIEANLFAYRFCSFLHFGLVDAVLDALPPEIEIEHSNEWKFHEAYEAGPGRPKIRQKQKQDDFEYVNEFYADGVRPIGVAALEQVLKSAFRKANLPEALLIDVIR